VQSWRRGNIPQTSTPPTNAGTALIQIVCILIAQLAASSFGQKCPFWISMLLQQTDNQVPVWAEQFCKGGDTHSKDCPKAEDGNLANIICSPQKYFWKVSAIHRSVVWSNLKEHRWRELLLCSHLTGSVCKQQPVRYRRRQSRSLDRETLAGII
jgi:hypothetical protein